MEFTKIHGVIPPLITPFTKSGELDEQAHIFNLGKWNQEKLAGYLILGSNGEAPYLTEKEKLHLIELTLKQAAKGRVLIAGTGLESTRETIRLTNLAAGVGAQAALILTPTFFAGQMGDEAQVDHFRRVADGSRIPVLIYNVPAYTRLTISLKAVEQLSTHPNIIGIKDSSGDIPRLEAILNVVPKTFQFIVGSASAWYPALQRGVRAGILALSNLAGNACAQVQRFHDEGNASEAEALHERLVPVNTTVTSTYGVAGLKYACSLFGYQSGYVRSPLRELSNDSKVDIKNILTNAGFF